VYESALIVGMQILRPTSPRLIAPGERASAREVTTSKTFSEVGSTRPTPKRRPPEHEFDERTDRVHPARSHEEPTETLLRRSRADEAEAEAEKPRDRSKYYGR
jgi:hypothetical protein